MSIWGSQNFLENVYYENKNKRMHGSQSFCTKIKTESMPSIFPHELSEVGWYRPICSITDVHFTYNISHENHTVQLEEGVTSRCRCSKCTPLTSTKQPSKCPHDLALSFQTGQEQLPFFNTGTWCVYGTHFALNTKNLKSEAGYLGFILMHTHVESTQLWSICHTFSL